VLKCGKCGRVVEKPPEGRLRCPYCGCRVLFKPRAEVVKRVKAV
jgi:DNA-directed RNA polymerase subunit P